MKKNKLKKIAAPDLINPVDYFNLYGTFEQIMKDIKIGHAKNDTEIYMGMNCPNPDEPTFVLNKKNMVEVKQENHYGISTEDHITKFMLLSAIKFRGNFYHAVSWVDYQLMKTDIPYIRVGTDYFKIITKRNRYNADNKILKPWKKDEIKEDHGKTLLGYVYKFDDFTIVPDNTDYQPVINNCWNLYAEFPYQPSADNVYHENIPVTMGLIFHIFGDQWELGLKYMKILYEYPKQILPVLALVSTERETGKTTFLNWIQMIFGENSTLINPSDLMSSFNDGYATKNIIMIDETVIDKMHTIEKLKSIATAKTISVSQKFVSHYSVPFFGKVILCTNKETDFMRIDEEEIRFWVRKINPIQGAKNTKIEEQLFDEIPKFLKYLKMMPQIDFSKSRMVFTQDEIKTIHLNDVKEESKSTLRKEIEYLICDFFANNPNINEIEITAKDIKERWFLSNNNISITYIRKVLKEEMKVFCHNSVKRYRGFSDNPISEKVGQPFLFVNNQSVAQKEEEQPF